MSRGTLMIAVAALVVAVVGVVLPFVMTSDDGGADDTRIAALESRVNELQSRPSGSGVRIAYVEIEGKQADGSYSGAFSVFLEATADLRAAGQRIANEITALNNDVATSTISQQEYQQRMLALQAELKDAQIDVDLGTLDRMIASDAFANVRSELEQLREQARPVSEEAKNLVSLANTGIIDPTEFQTRYATVETLFQQLDQLVTNVASMKIVEAAGKIANQYGYDLVIREENVIIYRNAATITDITDLVKSEIATYL